MEWHGEASLKAASMSLSPLVLQELSSLCLNNTFCWGLCWPDLVFRQSCHQDAPWLHTSSILRVPVPFATVAIALSLLGHWRALRACTLPVPVVTNLDLKKEERCSRNLRKIAGLLGRKQIRSCSFGGQSWCPTELWTAYRGVTVGLCVVVRKYEAPSSKSP